MSPSRILRISDFCQQRTERKVKVKLKIISSIPRRRRRAPSRIFEEESTLYVSVDLLVALSIQIGDVAWLSCSPDSLKDVPVVLAVTDECGNSENSEFVVEAPPAIATSIGANSGCDSCYLRTCNDELSEANAVKVRPLGRPIPPSWRDIPSTVPTLASTSKTRLLAQSSLISVLDESGGLFIYEVVDIESDQRKIEAALATSATKWILEPVSSKNCMRRLPSLSMAASFHNSTRLNEDKTVETEFKSGVSFIEADTPPPHPSMSEMVTALSIQPNARGQQRVLHVEGTDENHVGRCIECAANTLGMRYLPIHGLAAHAHASGIPVSTGSHVDQLAGLKAALQHAQECAPCVLHLFDIDQEWSQDDESTRYMQQQRLWTAMMDALVVQHYAADNTDFLHPYVPSVIVVVSTAKSLSAGPLLQNLVFESLVLRRPDETYARYIWNNDSTFDDLFSSHLEGRSARDISHLHRYWKHCASQSNKMEAFNVFCAQLDAKQRKSTPHIPSVHWQDVGGMANVRSEIMDAIELPLQHPNLFPNGGRSGILLYGPPGTGKTLIAKAVATECGLPFLSVKGPELLGSYVGESEANVRATFAAARKAATQGRTTAASILFFDELDSLAPRRGDAGDNGGVMDRVVATLLAELDGSPSADDGTVFVIGATNRPDLLDPSLLRPGRLDRLVYLGMASTSQDRAQILAAQIRKFRLAADNPVELSLQVIDRLPPNLTGADFSAISSGALRMSLERVCNDAEDELKRRQAAERNLTLDNILDEWEEDRLRPIVTADDLIDASKHVVPSVSAKQLADYERLRPQFSST